MLRTVVVTVTPPSVTTAANFPFLTALGVDASGVVLASVSFSSHPPDNGSELTRLDPATGVLTRLDPTGFFTFVGLQFDPGFHTLYAITSFQVPPVLVALNPTTGQDTVIAETDLPAPAEGLTFTADGRLVVSTGDSNLYELDPVTGVSRLIGPTGTELLSGLSLRRFE